MANAMNRATNEVASNKESIMRVRASDFVLTSFWRCGESKRRKGKWEFAYGPSVASATINFPYTLSSGSKIYYAKVFANVSKPLGGISSITANGVEMKKQSNGAYYADVKLQNTNAILAVAFTFRSGGYTYKDYALHSGTVSFTNVYLEISYNGSVSTAKTESQAKINGYPVPPQSVCFYDHADDAVYTFDGVLKVQHNLSMDIQEEPDSAKKDKYINNAKNEPDKITLDVMMSDVYTGGGSIIDKSGSLSESQRFAFNRTKSIMIGRDVQSPWTRSENAFSTLHWLKEERRKLMVITPQFIYTDMILASVTVNHEDTTPFGWEGQIGFQRAYEEKKKEKNKATTPKAGDGTSLPTAAAIAGGLGAVIANITASANETIKKSGD